MLSFFIHTFNLGVKKNSQLYKNKQSSMNGNRRFGRADVIALKWKLLFALPVLAILIQKKTFFSWQTSLFSGILRDVLF